MSGTKARVNFEILNVSHLCFGTSRNFPTSSFEHETLVREAARTCFAAKGSFSIPQPLRKQLASSKMARTSSPLAAPPLLRPACRASCSTDAAFEAAAVRWRTASVGFGSQPQPCLEGKGRVVSRTPEEKKFSWS